MQAEFEADDMQGLVNFLAINGIGESSGVEAATASVTLPLLADTSSDDVWSTWNAVWRDLVILNGKLEEVDRINLTDFDLSETENYEALKEQILATVDEL